MKTTTRHDTNYGTALPIAVLCGSVAFNAIYLLAVGSMLSKRSDKAAVVIETPMSSSATDNRPQRHGSRSADLHYGSIEPVK